ncbi:MAG: hypothetical protein WDA06_04385 [Phenylobacterium sp.]
MSVLIKSTEAVTNRVRQLPPEPAPSIAPAPPPVDYERLALEHELQSLKRALEARDEKIRRLEAAVAEASRDGEAKGREVGLQEAADRQEERLKQLGEAVDRALTVHGRQMAELERLAIQLASAGLDKILGASERFQELVAAALRQQVSNLAREAIVRVEVSAKDFADAAALEALAEAFGRPDVEVAALHELAAGDCRIRLQLGVLEAGPLEQWRRLRALYDHAAGRDSAR